MKPIFSRHKPNRRKRVVIKSTKRADLNGKDGIASLFENGRYIVTLDKDGGMQLKLKPENLRFYS